MLKAQVDSIYWGAESRFIHGHQSARVAQKYDVLHG